MSRGTLHASSTTYKRAHFSSWRCLPRGCLNASYLDVAFHAALARGFGFGRADVVHYFLLRTTMAARQKKQVKIEGRPVWAGGFRFGAYAQFAGYPRLRQSGGRKTEDAAQGALDRQRATPTDTADGRLQKFSRRRARTGLASPARMKGSTFAKPAYANPILVLDQFLARGRSESAKARVDCGGTSLRATGNAGSCGGKTLDTQTGFVSPENRYGHNRLGIAPSEWNASRGKLAKWQTPSAWRCDDAFCFLGSVRACDTRPANA